MAPRSAPGRKTRIVATLGPASNRQPVLGRLLAAGVDVVRLNFSHGTPDEHAETIRLVRAAEKKLGWNICILQDLAGPKIRLGAIEGGEISLRRGQRVAIDPACSVGGPACVGVTYENLARAVRPGQRILLDDGRVELKAVSVSGRVVNCSAVRGQVLGQHKGLNLPGVELDIPSLTEKDHEDLAFGMEHGVDAVAMSFVNGPDDVIQLRERIRASGGTQPVLAKLERASAIKHLAAILAVADGLMVARGDMAVELSPEQVPVVQKHAIAQAMAAGKPVITATQMLESMVDSPRPTRAEASDVANAIIDGTDAVMLSEETAAGHYPVEAVRVMSRIASTIERARVERPRLPGLEDASEVPRAVARAACEVADTLGAVRLVVFTQTGSSARFVSKCRPRTPILAVTPVLDTARRLQLLYGVRSIVVPASRDAAGMLRVVDREATRRRHAKAGDVIVVVYGAPIGTPGSTNAIRVHRVGG